MQKQMKEEEPPNPPVVLVLLRRSKWATGCARSLRPTSHIPLPTCFALVGRERRGDWGVLLLSSASASGLNRTTLSVRTAEPLTPLIFRDSQLFFPLLDWRQVSSQSDSIRELNSVPSGLRLATFRRSNSPSSF